MHMKKYPDEFKRQALKLAAQPGMNLRPAESDLGITRGLLYKWRQRFRVEENSADLRPSAEREAEAKIRRLKRAVRQRERENEVLLQRIRDIFGHSRQRYGNRRVHAELCAAAWANPRPYSRHPTPHFCYPHIKAP